MEQLIVCAFPPLAKFSQVPTAAAPLHKLGDEETELLDESESSDSPLRVNW